MVNELESTHQSVIKAAYNLKVMIHELGFFFFFGLEDRTLEAHILATFKVLKKMMKNEHTLKLFDGLELDQFGGN